MARSGTTQLRWLEVFRGLRADIASGTLPAGSALPTLTALAKREGLSVYGARRVMERLCETGLAQGWQGKGYSVAPPRLRLKIHETRPVFGEKMRQLGYSCSSHLLSAKTAAGSHAIARRLGRRSGTRVLATETLRKISGTPFAVSFDCFLQERLDGLDVALRKTGSVSRALAEHGVESYNRDHTTLTARLPSAHEALLLGIPKSQPFYETVGANIDSTGLVFQVSKGVWRADSVTYEF
ncbi:MAG: GntR family transcriptional regulator [Pseudomonadota bacterium]